MAAIADCEGVASKKNRVAGDTVAWLCGPTTGLGFGGRRQPRQVQNV